MAPIFASRGMFIKVNDLYNPVVVSIYQPIDGKDGFFYSWVKFSVVEKLNARIRGSDGINCLECALAYLKGVCRDSENPRFYMDEDEPYMGL